MVYPKVAYPSYEMGAALVGADAAPSDDPAGVAREHQARLDQLASATSTVAC